jgi:carboxylesterase type B
MGVPYAKPPVGKLRFQHAREWEDYSGATINATGFKPACLQFGYFIGNDYGLNPWGNSEDCLYLNV